MNAPEAEVLNAGLLCYVATFPTLERLQEFFSRKGVEGQSARAIQAELDWLLRTAEKHLSDYPGGVPWGEDFEREYRDLLKRKHPWVSDETVRRVFGFSRWLCWHEGLNRPG